LVFVGRLAPSLTTMPVEKMCPLLFAQHPIFLQVAALRAPSGRRSKMMARRRFNPPAVFLTRPPPPLRSRDRDCFNEFRGCGSARASGQTPPSKNCSGGSLKVCRGSPRRDRCIKLSNCLRSPVFVHAPQCDLRRSRCAKSLRHAELSIVREAAGFLPQWRSASHAPELERRICFEGPRGVAVKRLRRFRRSETRHLARRDGAKCSCTS
jgi:hypothetical protein